MKKHKDLWIDVRATTFTALGLIGIVITKCVIIYVTINR